MSLATIDYSVNDAVARITLNRPETHNAMNHQLLADIDEAFDRAEKDDTVKVIVLAANGPSFCTGYDRKGSPYTTPPDEGWTMDVVIDRLGDIEQRYLRIWNCPKPTIAQVHGHCIAAGCYLQLLCDISVAADDANLGHPVSHGFVSSMPLWQVILGPRLARYFLFTGRTVDGKTAADMGLVTMAVPEGELDETVDGIAADMCAGEAVGLRVGKEALNLDLEMMGVGAMFRYHGHMNALGRLRHRSRS